MGATVWVYVGNGELYENYLVNVVAALFGKNFFHSSDLINHLIYIFI